MMLFFSIQIDLVFFQGLDWIDGGMHTNQTHYVVTSYGEKIEDLA